MARISPANRRFVLAYILLVGVPLLGLAGVLKFGRGLSAPISVDGVWKLSTDGTHLPPQCAKGLAFLQGSLMTFSQSGKDVTVTVNSEGVIAGSGVIEGTTLNASLPVVETTPNEPGCSTDNVLTLRATVDPKLEPRSMQGIFSFQQCPSCSSVSYHAVRQSRSSRSGAH